MNEQPDVCRAHAYNRRLYRGHKHTYDVPRPSTSDNTDVEVIEFSDLSFTRTSLPPVKLQDVVSYRDAAAWNSTTDSPDEPPSDEYCLPETNAVARNDTSTADIKRHYPSKKVSEDFEAVKPDELSTTWIPLHPMDVHAKARRYSAAWIQLEDLLDEPPLCAAHNHDACYPEENEVADQAIYTTSPFEEEYVIYIRYIDVRVVNYANQFNIDRLSKKTPPRDAQTNPNSKPLPVVDTKPPSSSLNMTKDEDFLSAALVLFDL